MTAVWLDLTHNKGIQQNGFYTLECVHLTLHVFEHTHLHTYLNDSGYYTQAITDGSRLLTHDNTVSLKDFSQ